MNLNHRRIQIALSYIKDYSGEVPFSIYLKNIFRQNKNWGSKDRKFYRRISFLYWRISHQIKTNDELEIIDYLLDQIENNTPLKYSPYKKFNLDLTADINHTYLCKWFKQQAPVFFYLLKDKNLISNGVETDIDNCFSYDADSKLEGYVNGGIGIIQDWSSTASIKYLLERVNPKSIWETCSGAGGKSIVLKYLLNSDYHYASDIRDSIIGNLKNRFSILGIRAPKTQIIDLSDKQSISNIPNVDIVNADMPCSGSGTWRRTPERVTFCNKEEILGYSEKQLNFLQNLADNNEHEYIYYMTCSIFKVENEDVIDKFISRNSNYTVEWQKMFHTPLYGGSDFIFGCLLKRVD